MSGTSSNTQGYPQEVIDALKEFDLPQRVAKHLDLDVLDRELSEGMTQEARNSFILTWMYDNKSFDTVTIFTAFQDDFGDWEGSWFVELDPSIKKAFRHFLRYRGLYTGKSGQGHRHDLQYIALAKMERIPAWDEDELREQEVRQNTMVWHRQQRLMTGGTAPNIPYQPQGMAQRVQTAVPTTQTAMQPLVVMTPQQAPPEQAPVIDTSVDPDGKSAQQPSTSQEMQEMAAPPQADTNGSMQTPRTPATGAKVPLGPQNRTIIDDLRALTLNPVVMTEFTLPAIHFEPNAPTDRQTATFFSKAWRYEDSYSGEPYDILDDKVTLFHRLCTSQGIPKGQYHALFHFILRDRAKDYYIYNVPGGATFAQMCGLLKTHFDTEVNHAQYNTDWTSLTFSGMRSKKDCEGKDPAEVLQALLDKLQKCQRALGPEYRGQNQLIDQTMRACRAESVFSMALFNRPATFETLCSQLRSSMETARVQQNSSGTFATFFTTRTFRGNGGKASRPHHKTPWKNKCYVCGKVGCFSTKHTPEERKASKDAYLAQKKFSGSKKSYLTFLLEYEGDPENDDGDDSDLMDDDADIGDDSESFFTTRMLCQKAFEHRCAPQEEDEFVEATQFALTGYSKEQFQGILPDTGAAKQSTAGKQQFLALKRTKSKVTLNVHDVGAASVRFGPGDPVTSIGTVSVKTPIGTIKFHVLETPTPFLLCLEDMDKLGVYLNNVTNEMVNTKEGTTVPVVRKWGHPWFFLDPNEASVAFLTENELRRLHARFGHPSVARLHRLLQRSGHDVERDALHMISKFCHQCQMKGEAPRRFKFTLTDDHDFNHEVLVDVLALDGQNALQVVDAGTSFNAARFLASMTAREVWEAIKMCWIDVYLGPPDIITHDAGTNFASAEFRAEAKLVGITCHQVPAEAHWSIGKVERYHDPLRRAYEIIKAEMPAGTPKALILQMSVKAINDTVGPDGLVPTLLVFGAMPRMTQESPPTPSSVQRANAIAKAMTELRKMMAKRRVNDALNTRNGPNVSLKLPETLPLGAEVRIYREKGGWTGPYAVLDVSNGDVTVDTINGPLKMRNTHVQPYYRHPDGATVGDTPDDSLEGGRNEHPATKEPLEPFLYPAPPQRRGRGRPRKNPLPQQFFTIFVTKREKDDFELAHQLRQEGKIQTPGGPFEDSDALEIGMLIGGGTLKPIHESKASTRACIFKSRMVREVKGKMTDAPYEKSRLVIQGYKDYDKHEILTQAPTIQRCSQRLILALAPRLRGMGMTLMLRDITQAYPQSKTTLNREVYAQLPVELREKYPEGTILRVDKPLYGLAEAGAHWFYTYQGHHKNHLGMETSSFDPCLLLTTKNSTFGITGLQTDDTLNVGTKEFMDREESELQKAGFRAKPRHEFKDGDTDDFNGCRIHVAPEGISVRQKGQAEKLAAVKKGEFSTPQQYVEQRARGAYIASICQPEAAFDYSTAAQVKQPEDLDVKRLNQRIEWQLQNKGRGLVFIDVNLAKAKLMVFTDGSFANNRDMTSQIGYVIALATETKEDDSTFTIRGNVLHWSSTKCKRVTRSVLASEIYGLVGGFDNGFVLKDTIGMVADRLGIPKVPIVVCTDSYSLYECLVKLGTTSEKRLMIDIMSLRQSYERREIDEIRWINGADNPADAMTKANPNKALETLVGTNELVVRMEGWVQR